MRDQYWKRYKPNELEDLIHEKPLTEEGLRMVSANSHIQVSYVPFENPKTGGLVAYFGCENLVPKYHVFLNSASSRTEHIESFAHELFHIYYRCGYTYLDGENGRLVDKIIEKESVRALTKYSLVIKSILDACPEVNIT